MFTKIFETFMLISLKTVIIETEKLLVYIIGTMQIFSVPFSLQMNK